jgi:hypothetical protein
LYPAVLQLAKLLAIVSVRTISTIMPLAEVYMPLFK